VPEFYENLESRWEIHNERRGWELVSRLLLVERNTFIRESLRQILQASFPSLIIEESTDNGIYLSAMETFRPDIMILGVEDINDKGFKNLRQIRDRFPYTVIVLFTTYEVEEYRREAILRGANHIISKELWTGNEILALVKTILATKESWDRKYTEDLILNAENLRRPIERRKSDRNRLVRERNYLTHNPERRQQG